MTPRTHFEDPTPSSSRPVPEQPSIEDVMEGHDLYEWGRNQLKEWVYECRKCRYRIYYRECKA